jgi:hypothetical protein
VEIWTDLKGFEDGGIAKRFEHGSVKFRAEVDFPGGAIAEPEPDNETGHRAPSLTPAPISTKPPLSLVLIVIVPKGPLSISIDWKIRKKPPPMKTTTGSFFVSRSLAKRAAIWTAFAFERPGGPLEASASDHSSWKVASGHMTIPHRANKS